MPTKSYYQSHKKYLKEYRQTHKEEMKLYRQKYYQEHREHQLTLVHMRSQRIKIEVLTHYSENNKPKCKLCGINDIDILCLDHINGRGQEHRKTIGGSSKTLFYRLIKQGFPEGYQVLCANCNLKKEFLKRVK